jgi:ABC transporter DrrB family efflux protein
MARRLIMVWRRRPSYLVFSVLQPALLVLLLRYSIGGAMVVHVAGGYVNFLIPGAVAQAAAFTSLGTGVALAWELQTGVIDRLRAMPMSRAAILAGHLTAALIKTTVTIMIVIGIGYATGARFRNGAGPDAALAAVAIAFGLAVSCVSASIGLTFRDVNTVAAAGPIWLFPLVLLSSALAPVSTMPGWLQAIAGNQPVSLAVDTMRALALGGPLTAVLAKTGAWLAAVIVIFGALGVRAYARLT